MVKYTYDAWGNNSVSVLDPGANDIANLNPFRYRSYYLDTETNLYFLKTRYYDPKIGRFMTIDDISYLDPDSINGLNLYAYCGNNPVMAVDPTGHEWYEFWKWDWKQVLGITIAVGLLTVSIAGVVMSSGTLLVPVLVGAGIGAIASFVGQGLSNVFTGQNFFFDMDVYAIVMGGLAGAAFATGLGGVLGTMIIGAASNAGTQALEDKNWSDIVKGLIIGGIAAGVGYGVGQLVSKFIYGASDMTFGGFYELSRIDAGIIKSAFYAFISSWYTFLPSVAVGVTRGVVKALGNMGVKIFE